MHLISYEIHREKAHFINAEFCTLMIPTGFLTERKNWVSLETHNKALEILQITSFF